MKFDKNVLNLCKKIPAGKVSTYGIIAKKLKTSPRPVGQALKKNKTPVIIPCHRVVRSDGSLGGYSSGVNKKIKLLKKEGIAIKNKRIKNFEKVLFKSSRIPLFLKSGWGRGIRLSVKNRRLKSAASRALARDARRACYLNLTEQRRFLTFNQKVYK